MSWFKGNSLTFFIAWVISLAVVAIIGLLVTRISWTLFLVMPYNEFVGQGAWTGNALSHSSQFFLWGPRIALVSGPIGAVWYLVAQFSAGNPILTLNKEDLSPKAIVGILMCGWPLLPLCVAIATITLIFSWWD